MSLGYQHKLTTRMHKNSSFLWFSPMNMAANSSEHHPLNKMEMQESTRITIGEQIEIGTRFTPTNNRRNGWVKAHLANTTVFIPLGALESAKASGCGAKWTWFLQRLRGDWQEDAY